MFICVWLTATGGVAKKICSQKKFVAVYQGQIYVKLDEREAIVSVTLSYSCILFIFCVTCLQILILCYNFRVLVCV